jgi:hypothetical protein
VPLCGVSTDGLRVFDIDSNIQGGYEMIVTMLFLVFMQDTDLKPSVKVLLELQVRSKSQQTDGKAIADPIVISAIRSYEPVVLLVRDPYRCRDLKINTTIPTDKVSVVRLPNGVRIYEHVGLFGTRTTFDIGGYRKTVHIHKNGKTVIE